MPLALTSNDVTVNNRYNWDDVTGVRYHYPNGYRNMIQTGTEFVYYRGVRREDGRRGRAEYFGSGIVGEIWRDPAIPPDAQKKNWGWYCEIQDYAPFPVAVPAKVDGFFIANISQSMFRNGVRKISAEIFRRILAAAGMPLLEEKAPVFVIPELPDIQAVEIREAAEGLMAPAHKGIDKSVNLLTGRQARWSRNSKMAGDRSEEIVVRYIREQVPGATAIRHVAAEGKTPGFYEADFVKDLSI